MSTAVAAPEPSSHFPLPPRTSRILRAREKGQWLATVTNVIKGYAAASLPQKCSIVQNLLSLPTLHLALKPHQKAPRESTRSADANPDADPVKRATAIALSSTRYHGKAARALMQETVTPLDHGTMIDKLRQLHPPSPAPPVPRHCDAPQQLPACEDIDLKEFVNSLCNAKAPGPSGWTEELITAATSAENQGEWLAMYTDLINNRFDDITTAMLRRATLLGIPKKDGGVRPIAMGETFVKVATRLLLVKYPSLRSMSTLGDAQFAFRPKGTETIIHSVRRLLQRDDDTTTLLVDCRNAFNCVSISHALDAAQLGILAPIFSALYCTPSELLVRGSDSITTLTSEQGVRQGDVLGPLFFAIAVKPVLDELQRRHPSVQFFAYLDDITLVGSPLDLGAAMPDVIALLAEIGLEVNKRKTTTPNASLAATLGCSHDDTPRLLGGYIGPRARQILATSATEHTEFFRRLSKMHPEIALSLLRLCGAPRWNHIIRCHPPEETAEGSAAFDRLSTRAIEAILGIAPLHETHAVICSLPIGKGGLGVPSMTALAPGAYNASANGGSQKAATDILYKAIVESAPTDIKDHLKNNAPKPASAWLTSLPDDASALIPPPFFRNACLSRIGWNAEASTAYCRCGWSGDIGAVINHTLGCTHYPASGVQSRHHDVVRWLARILKEGGYDVSVEAAVGDNRRIDILATSPVDGSVTLVDVTVCNEGARSYLNKSPAELLAMKDALKQRTYEEAAQLYNARVHTAYVNTHAMLDGASLALVKNITGERFSEAIKELSRIIASGNGKCICRGCNMGHLQQQQPQQQQQQHQQLPATTAAVTSMAARHQPTLAATETTKLEIDAPKAALPTPRAARHQPTLAAKVTSVGKWSPLRSTSKGASCNCGRYGSGVQGAHKMTCPYSRRYTAPGATATTTPPATVKAEPREEDPPQPQARTTACAALPDTTKMAQSASPVPALSPPAADTDPMRPIRRPQKVRAASRPREGPDGDVRAYKYSTTEK